jgi:UDP-glucose:(heptosyl)LPS alpha-1,3-glucosyltransferase
VVRRECGFGLGGAESYCANVSTRLTRIGHDVTVVADRSTLPETALMRASVLGRGSLLKNLSFFLGARKALKRETFDLTYGLSRVAPVDLLRISDPLHAAWLDMGYRRASGLRALRPRHRMLLWMESKAIREAGGIVTNSMLVKGQIRRYYRADAGKITVIYNGVDIERFHPMDPGKRVSARAAMGLSENETVFLFAGSNLRRKGLGPLLRALGDLKGRRFLLLIAGPKGDRGVCGEIERMGLGNCVKWLGYVRDVERLYAISDLFILPTRYDPFANATLEAMACGTPALTTAQNGAGELVLRIDPRLVVPGPDPAAIAAGIKAFLALSTDERESLGEEALRLARQFTWQRHMEGLTAISNVYSRNG